MSNKSSLEINAYIKTLFEQIDYSGYNVDPVKIIYDYPTDLINVFPAITIANSVTPREWEQLGDGRYIESMEMDINGYISFIDARENYLSLLELDRAIRDKLIENNTTETYWRQSNPPDSDYTVAQFGEQMVRIVQLTWIIEHVTIPS